MDDTRKTLTKLDLTHPKTPPKKVKWWCDLFDVRNANPPFSLKFISGAYLKSMLAVAYPFWYLGWKIDTGIKKWKNVTLHDLAQHLGHDIFWLTFPSPLKTSKNWQECVYCNSEFHCNNSTLDMELMMESYSQPFGCRTGSWQYPTERSDGCYQHLGEGMEVNFIIQISCLFEFSMSQHVGLNQDWHLWSVDL